MARPGLSNVEHQNGEKVQVRKIHVFSMLVLGLTLGSNLMSCSRSSPGVVAPKEDPLNQSDAESLYRRGIALKKAGEFVPAEEYLKEAVKKGMPKTQVIPHLVDSAIQSSRFRMGLVYLEPLLEKDPNNWRVRYLAGTMYQALGEFRSAEIEFKRVIELAPQEGAPYFAYAKVLSSQYGRQDDAREHFLRFIELVPEGTDTIIARRWLHENSPENDVLKPLPNAARAQ